MPSNLIVLFNTRLLSTYSPLSTVLGTGEAQMNQTGTLAHEASLYLGDRSVLGGRHVGQIFTPESQKI